jgi:hypothetical protein
MEKPELKTVVEMLKEVDIREWEIIKNPHTHYGPYFELKRQGLVFHVEKGRRDGISYMFSIEDNDKNVRIVYKKAGKEYDTITKFYNELSKSIALYQEKDATEKLGFLLSENSLEESDLERIVSRLKDLDSRAWKPDKFFDKKYPVLITKVSGVTFCIQKGLIWGYKLEVKYEQESNKTIKYVKHDKKHARKLIGELYEKVYKELKEDKEKEFGERLNHFLTD